jgi:hypothetical protein
VLDQEVGGRGGGGGGVESNCEKENEREKKKAKAKFARVETAGLELEPTSRLLLWRVKLIKKKKKNEKK